MRMIQLIALLCLFVPAATPADPDLPDLSALPIAERDLARQVIALQSPELLPRSHDASRNERREHATCGTLHALALRSGVERASKQTQQALAFLFQRPTRAFSKISAAGHFLVHYNLEGSHAVSPADADQNGHPDYVDAVGDVFDDVWKQISQLGYHAPPPDTDGLFDIYIRNLAASRQFGVTYPESFALTSPSYIEIENNFTDPIYATQGPDGLRFTAAHEFFHAVQFGYYLSLEAQWWYELTATWMQDRLVDDVNDHYAMVSTYLQLPEAAMYEPPPVSVRPYGAMILGVYLSSVYGETTIRQTFEDLADRRPNPYTIDDTDPSLPGGFAGVLPRYWVWNYFTGSKAQSGQYYPEAAAYQDLSVREITPIGTLVLGGTAQVQSLGATYVRVKTAGKSGGLRVTFDLPSGPAWNLDVLLVSDSGVEVIRPQGSIVTIPDAADYQEVVFIASVLSLEGQVYGLSYTISMGASVTAWSDLTGDFDHSGTVEFADFLAFSESFGKPPETHHPPCDLNGDGRIGFTDFLIFAGHFGDSR